MPPLGQKNVVKKKKMCIYVYIYIEGHGSDPSWDMLSGGEAMRCLSARPHPQRPVCEGSCGGVVEKSRRSRRGVAEESWRSRGAVAGFSLGSAWVQLGSAWVQLGFSLGSAGFSLGSARVQQRPWVQPGWGFWGFLGGPGILSENESYVELSQNYREPSKHYKPISSPDPEGQKQGEQAGIYKLI